MSTGPQTCGVGGNTLPCSATPVAVSGLTGATAVVAGGTSQTCALLSDGTVACWGYNEEGELGDGMMTGPELCDGLTCSTAPVAVTGL
jgi:hypothetical protein